MDSESKIHHTPQFNNTEVLIKTTNCGLHQSHDSSKQRPGPLSNQAVDNIRSGDIVTAKLATSNSDQVTSQDKDILISLPGGLNQIISDQEAAERDDSRSLIVLK